MSSINFQIERLKKIPVYQNITWQGGFVRAPGWVTGEPRKPYRPWMFIWLTLPEKFAHHSKVVLPEEKHLDLALESLVDFVCNTDLAGHLPGKIEVRDSDLADYLEKVLAPLGIKVMQRERLVSLERLMEEMAESLSDSLPVPGPLRTKGVTMELMRAFAAAACEFYQAQPWQHLCDEDLILIENPIIDRPLRYVAVMGAGGKTFGLSFFDSPQQFEDMYRLEPQEFFARQDQVWSITFDDITELPLPDADLWEDFNLPVAGENAYPVALSFERQRKFRRPGVTILAFMEGLLRALAQTSESQIDSGKWEMPVDTFKGPMTFQLVLPEMLEPREKAPAKKINLKRGLPDRRVLERELAGIHRLLEEHQFEKVDQINQFLNSQDLEETVAQYQPTTPLEKAQDLIYQAFEVRGRRQLLLARQALEICPDCTDAYVLQAERTADRKKAHDLYLEGVRAGERVLGEDFFQQKAGHFWGILETRPYMRARLGLAQCLEARKEYQQAAEHYYEMLRLNPNDNQGVRHLMLPCLLNLNQDEQIETLLKKNKDDKFLAIWSYTRALVSFRLRGDNDASRKHLKHAGKVNPLVIPYLLGEEDLPPILPDSYESGSMEEAVICAEELMDVWCDTPGALEWLEAQAPD